MMRDSEIIGKLITMRTCAKELEVKLVETRCLVANLFHSLTLLLTRIELVTEELETAINDRQVEQMVAACRAEGPATPSVPCGSDLTTDLGWHTGSPIPQDTHTTCGVPCDWSNESKEAI
jgi:hypothetical protein